MNFPIRHVIFSSFMQSKVMLDCSICYPGCMTCLHDLFEACPNCELTQSENWHYDQNGAFNPEAYTGFDIVIPDQSTQSAEHTSLVTTSNTEVTLNTHSNISSGRRRDWTDAENREFERWITSNPKPTKLDKDEFASAHVNLTFQQVQNKINNWRNGRNVAKQRSVPSASGIARSKRSPQANEAEETKLNNADFNAHGGGTVRSGYELPSANADRSTSMADAKNELTAVDADQPTQMEDSPAPSILRYLESTELEADRDAIEHAVERVSLEDLNSNNLTPSPSHPNPDFSLDVMFGLRRRCDRCEKEGIEVCNKALPCRGCQDADDPVVQCSYSYSLRPTASQDHSEYTIQFKGAKNSTSTAKGGSSFRNLGVFGGKTATSPSPIAIFPPVPTPVYSIPYKSSSVAGSTAGSAKSSHSGRSSISARYQQKLRRRNSANNRRSSAVELHTPAKNANVPSHNTSRRSLPTMGAKSQKPSRELEAPQADSGRSEYFRCPTMTCTEIFRSRKELEKHEEISHFECYCTFCKVTFSDHKVWRNHENSHFQKDKPGELLWHCGICDSFGLSEPRRYLHIRDHWKERYDIRAWTGEPVVVTLTPEELNSLDWMTDRQFNTAAERLIKKIWRVPSSVLDKDMTVDEPRVRLKDRTTCSEEDSQAEVGPLPMAHGIFSSIRRNLPGFRKRLK